MKLKFNCISELYTEITNYKNISKKINHYIAGDESSNTRIYIDSIDKQTHTQIIIHSPVLPEKKVK